MIGKRLSWVLILCPIKTAHIPPQYQKLKCLSVIVQLGSSFKSQVQGLDKSGTLKCLLTTTPTTHHLLQQTFERVLSQVGRSDLKCVGLCKVKELTSPPNITYLTLSFVEGGGEPKSYKGSKHIRSLSFFKFFCLKLKI